MLTISTVAAGFSLASIAIIIAGIAVLTRRPGTSTSSWPTAEQVAAYRRRLVQ